MAVAVYPGSFDPLTIAHLAIAHAAVLQLELDRVDLAISRSTLGKAHLRVDTVPTRVDAIRRAAGTRPWLGVVVVDEQLVVEIAQGYEVVIMGADKWVQVNDATWYDDDAARRDRALERLPRVAVAPRGGIEVPRHLLLDVPGHLAEVSATEVRRGRSEWAAPVEPKAPDT